MNGVLLLPIYYKSLNGICDAAKPLNIHVLIVPQHFRAGVANQSQLVFIRCLHIFHQGRERVTATVGRVFPSVYTIDLCNGILDFTGLQRLVELFTICFDSHAASVFCAEHGAAYFILGKLIYDRLDLRGDGYQTILTCLSLCATDEGFLFLIVVAGIQIQKFRGPEAEIALCYDIVSVV